MVNQPIRPTRSAPAAICENDKKPRARASARARGSTLSYKPSSVSHAGHPGVRRRSFLWTAGHPATSSGLPAGSGEPPSSACLRGLAPDGVCLAIRVTANAVGSYPTFSPLPSFAGERRRFLFCGTLLGVTATGRYPASCSAELGLSFRPARSGANDRPNGVDAEEHSTPSVPTKPSAVTKGTTSRP